MFSTHRVINLLRETNPGAVISEDRVRHALRRGAVPRPTMVGGHLIWTTSEILALADALGLEGPVHPLDIGLPDEGVRYGT